MPDPLGLDVKNVQVATRTVANPGGQGSSKQYVVSYNIGTHGPFQDTYSATDYTADNVKANIHKQVQILRDTITGTTGAAGGGTT
jgi:hypothetical protein